MTSPAPSQSGIAPAPTATPASASSAPEFASATPSGPGEPPTVVLPTAPPETAGWPTCTTFQLEMTGTNLGAGLGNVAMLFRLRNASNDGCRLDGYPQIQLVSETGAFLPTTETHAVDGDYSFPAIPAGPVALGPGDTASFELGYGDNPSGAAISLPYDVACPTAQRVRIILPGTHQFGTAVVPLAPCEGRINVSPIFPGPDRVEFP